MARMPEPQPKSTTVLPVRSRPSSHCRRLAPIIFSPGEASGATGDDLVIAEGKDPQSLHPFKGNMDLARLEAYLTEHHESVPLVMITITNNAPASGLPDVILSSGDRIRGGDTPLGTSGVYFSFYTPLQLDDAVARIRVRRKVGRSAGDVSIGHLHDWLQLGGAAGAVDAVWFRL